MVAALMAFMGLAVADPAMALAFGTNPTKNLYNTSTNTSGGIVINVTFLNTTPAGDAFARNVTHCFVFLGLNSTAPNNVINYTNSSGLTIGSATTFTFLLANGTALSEAGKNAPYNLTVRCNYTNSSGTYDITNTTNMTVDWTAPSVTLNSPANLLINYSNGSIKYSFTVVDLGTNVSNCTLYYGSTNTTQSNRPSITYAENLSSVIGVGHGNETYLTTQLTDLMLPYNIPDSVNIWNVSCRDYAGNEGQGTNFSYIVDNSTITYVALVAPASNQTLTATSTQWFQFQALDAFLTNCSIMYAYSGTAGVYIANYTGSESQEEWTGSGWNTTYLYNGSTNTFRHYLGGNTPVTFVNWTINCRDLGGHNLTNSSTPWNFTLSNDTGAGSVGGGGLNPAPDISVVPGCAGEETSVTVSGIKTQATLTVLRLVTGQPSELVHTEVMSSDGTFSFVAPYTGDYVVRSSATGQRGAEESFSITCTAGEEETGGEEEIGGGVPPAEEEEEEEEAVPEEEEEEVEEEEETAMVVAQTALDDVTAAVLAASAAGKDTSEAQAKLDEAMDAYEAGDYELALTLANEAKSLAENAPAMEEEPVEEEEPAMEEPSEEEEEPAAGGFDWTWVIVVIVILAAVAYFLTRKRY